SPVSDPYANITWPSSISASTSLSCETGHTCSGTPGNYKTISVTSGAKLNLSAGTYYVSQSVTVSSGTTLNGTSGGTIVLVGSATINVSSGSTVNLVAPKSGTYKGLALIGGPDAASGTSSNTTQTFSSGISLNVTGALYFPQEPVSFSSGATSTCFELIG